MDERRQSTRTETSGRRSILWLVLDDGSKQMGVIDDLGDGGARIELHGVVNELKAGSVVGIARDESVTTESADPGQDDAIAARGRVAWINGRHLGLEFLHD